MESLTHSRMQSAKDCMRRHFLQYEFSGNGITKARQSEPLRFGTSIHRGLDLLAKGWLTDDVVTAIRDWYDNMPDWCVSPEDLTDWFVECEKVVRLLLGYAWHWGGTPMEIIATEQKFHTDLINPATGWKSKNWDLQGRIDKIIKARVGTWLMEHKTTSEDISDGSDYWSRMRIDSQISLYLMAARTIMPVDGVIYDVIAKPKTSLRNPLYQMKAEDKEKLNRDGTYFDESFDSEEITQAIEMKKESIGMYGARLASEIQASPENYYARRPIPRLDSDIEEFREELWGIQKRLTFCQTFGYWDKNTAACKRPWNCEMCDVCYGGFDVSEGAPIPPGYVLKTSKHQELEEVNNDSTNAEAATAAGTAI